MNASGSVGVPRRVPVPPPVGAKERIVALADQLHALQAELVDEIAAMIDADACTANGCGSVASWLTAHLGLSARPARQLEAAVQRLGDSPVMSDDAAPFAVGNPGHGLLRLGDRIEQQVALGPLLIAPSTSRHESSVAIGQPDDVTDRELNLARRRHPSSERPHLRLLPDRHQLDERRQRDSPDGVDRRARPSRGLRLVKGSPSTATGDNIVR